LLSPASHRGPCAAAGFSVKPPASSVYSEVAVPDAPEDSVPL